MAMHPQDRLPGAPARLMTTPRELGPGVKGSGARASARHLSDHPPRQIVVGEDELHRLGQLGRLPRCPTGMACCIRPWLSGFMVAVMSVAKTLGAMPITRMPWRASSRPRSPPARPYPAFAGGIVALTPCCRPGRWREMLMMTPCPSRAISAAPPGHFHRKVPVRLTSMTACHWARLIFSTSSPLHL